MDAVEEIKARLSIEDIIGEYVELKRAGRNYKGLSPFTSEKTPSFMVSPEKQIWHDFSSGKGGNIFSFVMEMEGLDFKGALELLARKAGVDLDQYRSGRSRSSGKLKERLYEVLEMATKFYQVQFAGSQKALEYTFKQRRFSKDIALAFRLGYAPNTGFALVDYLKKKGVSEKEMQQAGLTASRGRASDMFRGRLMVPLMDPTGRVIGFTARLLDENRSPASEAPKYINTPQTILYDKGRHIYGLHLAKEAIRKQGYAVVAEGNLDVISSHQAGIAQVVATAGTAMTEMHLKALNRFTGDIRLAFDQDKAGQAAAERSIPIAGKVGVSLGVITISEGKDPDELIKKDRELWLKAIEQPQYALDWLMDRYSRQLDLDTAAGKRQYSDIILAVVRKLSDQVEQDHYLQKIAKQIGVSQEALQGKLSAGVKAATAVKKQGNRRPEELDKMKVERIKTQQLLLALTLMKRTLREYLRAVHPDMLMEESAQKVLSFLQKNPDFAGDPLALEPLKTEIDYVKMLALQYEATYQNLSEADLLSEAARLRVRLIEQYVKHEKAALAAQMRDSDDTRVQTLLPRVKELDLLLRQTKENAHG